MDGRNSWTRGLVLLWLLASACEADLCEDLTPSFELRIRASDANRAAEVQSLKVAIVMGDERRKQSFNMEDRFLDGRTSLAIRVIPAPEKDFTLDLTVTAHLERGGAGEEIGRVEQTLSLKPNGCNQFEVTLSLGEPGDAGTDAGIDTGVDTGIEDGGSDGGLDAGEDGGEEDLGIDGGEEDLGIDGGEEAGVDMGVDSGTSTATDGGADSGVDGGVDGGSPDTGCPANCGGQCSQTCVGSCNCGACPCAINCPASETCNAVCGNGSTCVVTSTTGSTLDVDTDGDDLTVVGVGSALVDVRCLGSATCDITCENVQNCTVRCLGNAECLLRCINPAGPCGFSNCPNNPCTPGVYVCGRTCP